MQKSSGSAELFGRTRERKQNILMDEKNDYQRSIVVKRSSHQPSSVETDQTFFVFWF